MNNCTINLESSIFESGISSLIRSATAVLIEGPGTSYIINVTFQNNIVLGVTAAILYEVQHLHLINCSFVGNTATALYVVKSDIFVHGKLNFTGNSAYEGAAMYFGERSSVSVDNDTEISFMHNHADHTGGIKVDKYYISPSYAIVGYTYCFCEKLVVT